MAEQEAYDRARKRAKRKLVFYNHVIVYVVVIGFLFAINLFTSTDYIWVVWPMMGWGIALALHGASVYLRSGESETLDRMTERELERDKARHQNQRWRAVAGCMPTARQFASVEGAWLHAPILRV